MKLTEVKEGLKALNSTGEDTPKFYLITSGGAPLYLEVRFPKVKYQLAALHDGFKAYTDEMENISKNSMYAVTDSACLDKGIITFIINPHQEGFKNKRILMVATTTCTLLKSHLVNPH